MLFSWKKLAEQRGGRMGDIIDCLNGFHYTFAKSMTYFFLFRRILYPLHIRLLYNTLYPQSIDLPASVLQTSAYDIFLKLLLCCHPTHCLKASLSSAAVFMLQKCNYSCSIFVLCLCCYQQNYRRAACTVLHVSIKAWRVQRW